MNILIRTFLYCEEDTNCFPFFPVNRGKSDIREVHELFLVLTASQGARVIAVLFSTFFLL